MQPKHEGTIPWHTMGVYHLGNNVEFHRDVYRHAIQTPGLVVIHDLALDDFVRGMIAAGDPLGHQAMREGHANAPRLESFPDAVRNEPLRVPFVAHAARRARGIVAHSPFVERYLRAFGCRTPVYVTPHPVVESAEATAAGARTTGGRARPARRDGDADAGGRVRRPERGQADRRRAGGRGAAARGRPRRPGRPADRGLRRRRRGARAAASAAGCASTRTCPTRTSWPG